MSSATTPPPASPSASAQTSSPPPFRNYSTRDTVHTPPPTLLLRSASLTTPRLPRTDSLKRGGSLQRHGSLGKRVPPPKVQSIDLRGPVGRQLKPKFLAPGAIDVAAASEASGEAERMPQVQVTPPTPACSLSPIVPPARSSSLKPQQQQQQQQSLPAQPPQLSPREHHAAKAKAAETVAWMPKVSWIDVKRDTPSDANVGNSQPHRPRETHSKAASADAGTGPKRSLSFRDLRGKPRRAEAEADEKENARGNSHLNRSKSERVSPLANTARRAPPTRSATADITAAYTVTFASPPPTKLSFRERAATLAHKLTPANNNPPPILAQDSSSPPNSAKARTRMAPDHFTPPSFTPAEVEILRTQLGAASQELRKAAGREKKLEQELREAKERNLTGREILWGIVGERDAREKSLSEHAEALRNQVEALVREKAALTAAHEAKVGAMQREIEALSNGWLHATSPPPSPPLGADLLRSRQVRDLRASKSSAGASFEVDTSEFPTPPTADFPTGPVSVEGSAFDADTDSDHSGTAEDTKPLATVLADATAAAARQQSRHARQRSDKTGFGLFDEDEPLGDWEEGSTIHGVPDLSDVPDVPDVPDLPFHLSSRADE